jgi:hypothetical protein
MYALRSLTYRGVEYRLEHIRTKWNLFVNRGIRPTNGRFVFGERVMFYEIRHTEDLLLVNFDERIKTVIIGRKTCLK